LARLWFKPVSSPSGLVLAFAIQYINRIPPMHSMEILGMTLNDHTLLYFLSAALFMHAPLFNTLQGLGLGILYYHNVLGIAKWRLPSIITDQIQNLLAKRTGVDPNSIQTLVNMGFSRERAIEALEIKEDLDDAIAYLLNNN
jgi:hypothetical protein